MDDVFRDLLVQDHGPVATAYLYRSARRARRASPMSLAERRRRRSTATSRPMCVDAWRTEFIDESGHVQPATQANLVRALAFDLVPDDLRPQTADDLVALIRAAGTHLATGFPGDALPAAGARGRRPSRCRVRVAVPGHRTVVAAHDRERHDDDLGGLGCRQARRHRVALAEPLQQGRGHLVPAPLRRRVAVWSSRAIAASASHRNPGGGISWAETHHESPHGRIAVRWEQHSDRLDVVLDVPAGTTAEAVLPNGDTRTLGPGHHTLSS